MRIWRLPLLPLLLPAALPLACGDDAVDDEAPEGTRIAGTGGSIIVERSTGGAGGTGGGSGAPSPLALCTTDQGDSVADLQGDFLIDDFESGTPAGHRANGRMAWWFAYGDEHGTQSPSESNWEPGSPGRGGSPYALHTVGSGFFEWGSGNGMALVAHEAGTCLYDASVYDGITFWARGSIVNDNPEGIYPEDIGAVKVLLIEYDVIPVEEGGGCDGVEGVCWDSHRARFTPGECWKRYSIGFDEFAQDGWGMHAGQLDLDQLHGLNFEISRNHTYDLWVDDIEFYVGDKPEEIEDCSLGGNGPGAGGMGAGGMGAGAMGGEDTGPGGMGGEGP